MEDKVGALEAEYMGRMKAHLLSHDVAKAERAVSSKAGYWLGQREPLASTSVGKCRACEYNSVCARSLVKPTPASQDGS
jgi:hypothetical protein